MNTPDARHIALELMEVHLLLTNGWRFEFDHAKTRCGLCSYRRKTISLSRYYVSLNDESDVRNTILHEIAHALVGPDHHHDSVWKQMARKIGSTGDRCASSNIKKATGRYYGLCLDCGMRFERHKKINRIALIGGYSHTPCKRARKLNHGRIEWYYKNGQKILPTQPQTPAFPMQEAAQNFKSDITQSDINDMWARLQKIEGKLA